MTNRAILVGIKAVHSAIFLANLGAILWLVATGLAGRRDRSTAIAATLVAAESLVFVANRGVCPLTPLAERYGAADGRVSDIFLPDALARTIPQWSIPLVVAGALLHLRAWRRTAPASVPLPHSCQLPLTRELVSGSGTDASLAARLTGTPAPPRTDPAAILE